MSKRIPPIIVVCLVTFICCGCQGSNAHRNIEIARKYREHLSAEQYDHARAMLADNARLWFGDRSGEGRPLDPSPGTGPWAAWDDHFQSTAEPISWSATADFAIVIMQETNDYYELLERGPQHNSLTYFVDDDGRITGLVIGSAGPRPMGRTDEFLAWARINAPDEIAELMPHDEIDPSGNHPQRFRALLNRWRIETGREPIYAPNHE